MRKSKVTNNHPDWMMDKGIFTEDGMMALVEIFNDQSGSDWDRYDLKILEIQRPPIPWLKPPKIGEEFHIEQKRKVKYKKKAHNRKRNKISKASRKKNRK